MKSMIYKDYEVEPWSDGFKIIPGTLTKISSFIVKKDRFATGFAFAMDMLERMAYSHIKEADIEKQVEDIIKAAIDSGKMKNLDEYTFEFCTGRFYEVNNPTWWTKSGK